MPDIDQSFSSPAENSPCDDYELKQHLNFNPDSRDHRFYWLNLIPVVFTGLWGLAIASLVLGTWLPFLGAMLMVFVFWGLGLETRLQCSHCPHYEASKGGKISCWALRGYPKLWEYRPGDLTSAERIILFLCYGIIFGLPLASMIAGLVVISMNFSQYTLISFLGLAGIFLAFCLSSLHMLMVKRRVFCSRCLNFTCNLNNVPPSLIKKYEERAD